MFSHFSEIIRSIELLKTAADKSNNSIFITNIIKQIIFLESGTCLFVLSSFFKWQKLRIENIFEVLIEGISK